MGSDHYCAVGREFVDLQWEGRVLVSDYSLLAHLSLSNLALLKPSRPNTVGRFGCSAELYDNGLDSCSLCWQAQPDHSAKSINPRALALVFFSFFFSIILTIGMGEDVAGEKVRIICDMYFSQATGKEGFGWARKINSEYKFWKLKGQPNRVEKTNITLSFLWMLTFFSGLHSDQYLTLADPYFKTVDMSKQCGAYH